MNLYVSIFKNSKVLGVTSGPNGSSSSGVKPPSGPVRISAVAGTCSSVTSLLANVTVMSACAGLGKLTLAWPSTCPAPSVTVKGSVRLSVEVSLS